MYKKKIIIQTRSGFCNRLRYILPFIYLLIKNNDIDKKKIMIIWDDDEHCNGLYVKYFLNIKNTYFIKNNENIQKIIDERRPNITYINNLNDKKITLTLDKISLLENKFFKLNNNIYNKIKNIIRKLSNNYISIHVRRTDLESHLKYKKIYDKRTTDKDFIKFIKKNKEYNLYIATDNQETQEILINKFSDRIKYIKIINEDIKNRRQTELEDAIIDLFVCICSNKFKGTFYSSFSDFIISIRNNILKYKKKILDNPKKKLKLFI